MARGSTAQAAKLASAPGWPLNSLDRKIEADAVPFYFECVSNLGDFERDRFAPAQCLASARRFYRPRRALLLFKGN